LLKHKRLVSIIATIAFCLSFLAPALLAPAPAVAASTYEELSVATVGTTPATPSALGIVKVYIPDVTAFKDKAEVVSVTVPGELWNPTVTYPTGINTYSSTLACVAPDANTAATVYNAAVYVEVPALYDGIAGHNNPLAAAGAVKVSATSLSGFDIKIDGTKFSGGTPGVLYVHFGYTNAGTTYGIDTRGKSGDLEATFAAPPGSAFNSGKVTIGKVTSSKLVMPVVASVTTMGTAGDKIDSLVLVETSPGAIGANDTFTFKLPSGFEWTNSNMMALGSWGFDGKTSHFSIDISDSSKLVVKVDSTFTPSTTTAGRIVVGSTATSPIDTFAHINVTDDTKLGDVVVSVTSNNCDLTTSELTVATIKDYGVTVSEGTAKNVKAGQREVELGSFFIEEGIAGSLVDGRSLTLTLPDGVKWSRTNTNWFSVTTESGDTVLKLSDFSVNGGATRDADVRKVLKGKISRSGAASKASKTKIDKLRVDIAPNFSGDLYVEVAGSAGAAGKVKVATVSAPVSVEVDGTPTDVIIGQSNQAVADILIKENAGGAIKRNSNQYKFVLFLQPGVTFTSTPKVEVIEGDLQLDAGLMTRTMSYGGILRGALELTVKSESIKPSTIKVSDIKVTVDRTVPEGDMMVLVNGGGIDGSADAIDENRVNVINGPAFNYDYIAAVAAAECVTPAGEQGRSASFYIGSTIMNVNGNNIIMDAAPYIKAGRTYVPVRYLGDALGAETTWDAATKTVTVTKGDKTVVLVIGSTIAKVNGADVQMDVAPEITGVGRTMLPARWVAEGLGYQVGWNAALQQVVIQ